MDWCSAGEDAADDDRIEIVLLVIKEFVVFGGHTVRQCFTEIHAVELMRKNCQLRMMLN